jgi:hypothetical protein
MAQGLGTYLVEVETCDGERYAFDGKTQIRILTGRSAPETRITENARPLQNHSYVEYSTFAPRRMTATLQILGEDAAHMWKYRQDMYRIFNPFKGPFTLRLTHLLRGATYTAYNVLLTDAMDSPLDTKVEPRYSKYALTFTAYDPFWYGADNTLEIGSLSGTPGSASSTLTVTDGNYWASPRVQFIGPLTNPVLSNTIYKGVPPKKLELLGTVPALHYVVVDTRLKTVTSSFTPQITLKHDSNLNTFGLIPRALGADGANRLALSATGYTSASKVVLTWDDTYYAI